MAGETSYTLEEADYIAAHRAAFAALINWRFARVVILIALFAAGAMTAAQYFGGEDLAMSLTIGGMMGLILGTLLPLCALVNYLKIPARARRLFRQNKLAHYPQTVVWNDREIRVSSARGTLTTPLTDFHHWRYAHFVFLLYGDEASFQVIPQRALDAGPWADLYATLVAHGPPRG